MCGGHDVLVQSVIEKRQQIVGSKDGRHHINRIRSAAPLICSSAMWNIWGRPAPQTSLKELLVIHHDTGAQGPFKTTPFQSRTFACFILKHPSLEETLTQFVRGGWGCEIKTLVLIPLSSPRSVWVALFSSLHVGLSCGLVNIQRPLTAEDQAAI